MVSAEPVEFPFLPDAWVQALVKGEYKQRSRAGGSDKALTAWLSKRPNAKGDPCKQMARAMEVGLDALGGADGGGAHDELNDRVYELIKLSVEGHQGVWTALKEIQTAFVEEVAVRRREDGVGGTVRTLADANDEFRRELYGAIRIIKGHLAEPEQVAAGLGDGAGECVCDWVPETDGSAGKALDPFLYTLNDKGNALQLVDLADGNLLYVPEHSEWTEWSDEERIWTRPEYSAGMQWAMRIPDRIALASEKRYQLAEQVDGTDAENALSAAKKLQDHALKTGNEPKLAAMLKIARDIKGMARSASAFDASPKLLHCMAGTVVELNDDGVEARQAVREDLGATCTGAPYNPNAKSELWDSYLSTFLPDPKLRDWLHRVLGYSLYGANPLRALVFLHGPTRTGKSTILESIGAALGGYGAAIDLSVFRASQSQGSRVDLVRILTKRFVYASEAGSEWHLHADQLKKVTGGDTVIARLNFGNKYFEAVPPFTPFIATNEAPQITHADAALWDRMWAVPFDTQVDHSDPYAASKLRNDPEARAAILAWLVAGWQAYRERDPWVDVPAAVTDRTLEFRGGVSEHHAWFYDHVVEAPHDKYLISSELYNAYRSHMASIGAKDAKTEKAFGSWVTGLGFPKAKKARVVKGEGPVNVRHGMQWK